VQWYTGNNLGPTETGIPVFDLEEADTEEADMDVGDVVVHQNYMGVRQLVPSHGQDPQVKCDGGHNAGLVIGVCLDRLLAIEWACGCRSYEPRYMLQLDRSENVVSETSAASDDNDADAASDSSGDSWSTMDSETEYLEKQESELPPVTTFTQPDDAESDDSWSTVGSEDEATDDSSDADEDDDAKNTTIPIHQQDICTTELMSQAAADSASTAVFVHPQTPGLFGPSGLHVVRKAGLCLGAPLLDWPVVTMLESVHSTHKFVDRAVNTSLNLAKRMMHEVAYFGRTPQLFCQ
jgi:hypothetical protein